MSAAWERHLVLEERRRSASGVVSLTLARYVGQGRSAASGGIQEGCKLQNGKFLGVSVLGRVTRSGLGNIWIFLKWSLRKAGVRKERYFNGA